MNESVLIDWKLLLPLILIYLMLTIAAIYDWLKAGDNVRGNRWVWLAVIVIISTVGPIIYFIFGRRR